MNRIQVLTGDNISLVVPEREDALVWYKGINNIEVQGFLNFLGGIIHKESEEEYYESLRKDTTNKTFSIYAHETEKVIGNISLMKIDTLARNAEIGIMICDTDEQNKGYGTESMKLLLKYAFEVLGLHKVSLEYVDFNSRAKKLYKKLGFVEIGIKKQEKYMYGKYCDLVLTEMMRSEYEEIYTK